MYKLILKENEINFKDLEKIIYKFVCNQACEMIVEILEKLDEKLMKDRDKKTYRNKGFKKTSIKTVMGEIEYRRRIYEYKTEEGKNAYKYILDEYFKMDTIGHISTNLVEKIVDLATDESYRKTASKVTEMTNQSISHSGAWNIIQNLGKKIKEKEKREIQLNKNQQLQGVKETKYRTVYEMVYSSWQTYTQPFIISEEGTTEIQTKTIDNTGNESNITSEKVTINKNIDVNLNINTNPDVSYSSEDYTVTLTTEYTDETVQDSVYSSVYYKLNDEDFKIYKHPFTTTQKGQIIITAKVIDGFGNTSNEITKTVYIYEDEDEDNDGVSNEEDQYPLDDTKSGIDTDEDGEDDAVDEDDDNDGVVDSEDPEPKNPEVPGDVDITPPEITLKGDKTVTIEQGNLYTEKGYTAVDNIDGDITGNVDILGYFNTNKIGTYILTYKVEDSSANESQQTRTIEVVEKQIPKESIIEADDEEKIDDKKVEDAIEGAKQKNKEDIKIKVNKEVNKENDVKVSVSKQQVDNAKNNNVNLTFETENTSIKVPMKAVDTSNMKTNSRLELVCEQVDTEKEENKQMVEAVKSENEAMEIYENKVYDFKMKVVEEDEQGNKIKEEEIEDFTSEDEDIKLRIVIGEKEEGKSLMTYYFNPDTGKWEYVRGRYNNGTVEILTNHLSIYSVMTLTEEQKREELTKEINKEDITLEEVLNILEDEDMNFDEIQKYNTFEQKNKNETGQDIIDNKPESGYADYDALETEFNAVVNEIYERINSDNESPQITLNGETEITLIKGQVYTEQGATATDNIDGDITGRIIVKGEVDTSVVGTYELTYKVSDLKGNTAQTTRTIKVEQPTTNNDDDNDSNEQKLDKHIEIIKGKDNIEIITSHKLEPKDKDMHIRGKIYEIEIEKDEESLLKLKYEEKEITNEDRISVYAYAEENKEWKCIGGKVDKENNEITVKIGKTAKIAIIENNKTFKDIQEHWAKEKIEILASRQIIDGDGQGNYKPNMGITRAEFATLITKTLRLETKSSKTGFKDILENEWYAPYIKASKDAGIVKGVSETEYQPQRIVNRQEMTAMVIRAYKLINNTELTEKEIKEIERFIDNKKISDWARKDIYIAKALKLVKGRSKDKFVPKSETLRGEAATLIYRLLEALERI